jgi:hypothetical protein
MCYKTEILRLGPQNDIATQSLDRGALKTLDSRLRENDEFYRNRGLWTDTI